MGEIIYERLKEIEELEYDWNGYDAEPIPTEVLYNVGRLLECLENNGVDVDKFEIFPTARESIQLERKVNKCYIEVEVYDDKMSVYICGRYNVDKDEISIYDLIKEIKFIERCE